MEPGSMAVASTLDWPLVGRDDELVFLRRSRRGGGAILSGSAGVGKSRLAAEAANEASSDLWSTVMIRASAGLSGLPLAGLRATLDVAPSASADLSALAAEVERALETAAGERSLLLVVDDAHLLDEESAGLLHSLVARSRATLLATVRSGVPTPPAVTAMWKDGLVERLELQPLSRVELEQLVSGVFGEAVGESTIERLWQTTEGNPLYVREVVLASLETGALAQSEGTWRWQRGWAASQRVQEIVAERLGRLDADEQTVLEALAVGGPLPTVLLADLASVDAVARLERRGLVTAGDPAEVAHPVHADVMRSQLPAMQMRSICRTLVDANARLAASGQLTTGGVVDQVRVARWSLESGIPVDPVTLTRAADATLWHIGEALAGRIQSIIPGAERPADGVAGGSARPAPTSGPDPRTVINMATAAWQSTGGVDAGASLAVALAWTGDTHRASAVLGELRRSIADADDELRIAIALAQVQFWGEQRVDAALDTLAGAARDAPSTADRGLRAEVFEDWAGICLNIGRPSDAIDLATRAADCLGIDLAAAPSAPAAAAALGLLGRGADALDLVERAMPAAGNDPHRPLAVAQLLLARSGALVRLGRVQESYELAEACRSIALDIDSLDGTAVYGVASAEALLHQGRVANASRRLRDVCGLLAERDVLGYRAWALSSLARARALAGDEAGAVGALEQAEEVRVLTRYFESRLYMARAAVATLLGRRAEAVAHARAGADWCADAGMVADEALLVDVWHRAEPSSDSADRLTGLATRTDSPLVHGLARHARALVERDAAELVEAADDLAGATAWLLAAEAAAAASFIYADRHDTRAAQSAARRAQAWADRCEGARTPLLDRLGAPSILTGRELEVARFAAAGQSSKAIAARLGVSVRTVDTHLYRSYTKLGVNDRAGLADALTHPSS